MDLQVVIVGGGPAAHNAALALGRARKRVLLCDEGKPRNRVSAHSHTFFTRDGTPPLELRRIALEQLAPYETVSFASDRVTAIDRQKDGFRVSFDSRDPVTTRLVLLAVGMVDRPLPVEGFAELWGDTVIHCPYCHGWEVRDLPWAVYLEDDEPVGMLPLLRSWTDDVVVIVSDGATLSDESRSTLARLGLPVEAGTLRRLHAVDGKLNEIELEEGRRIARKVLLHSPPQVQTPLVRSLGLKLDEDGYVVTDEMGRTSEPGIYAAGDVATGRQQIALAAAAGLRAGIGMDRGLAGVG